MKRTFAWLLLLIGPFALRAAEPTLAGRPLQAWIADLDAKDTLIREEAIEVLQEFGGDAKSALPKLLQLYQSDVPAVRARAALALWRIDGRTEPARTVLLAALKTGTANQRMRSVHLLLQLGTPAAELAPPVLELLHAEPDYYVLNQVQTIVMQIGTDAVPALRTALQQARGDGRMQLLTLILNIGPPLRGLLPDLQPLRKQADLRVRFLALRAIYRLDPLDTSVIADFVQAGASTDAGLRREALQAALSLTGRSKELAPLFRGFLKDDDLNLRCRAAAALFQSDSTTLKETLPVVRAVLQDVNNPNWQTGVMTLAWFGPAAKDALPDLQALLKRPDGRNYGYTIAQTCRSIGPEAVPLLLEIMEDPQNYYRTQAMQSLSAIGPEALPKLLPALQHQNPLLRQSVLDVMLRLGPGARAGVPTIAKSLKDGDVTVRDRVLTILDGLGPDAHEATPALVEFLRDLKQDELRRWRALDALGKIGPTAKSALTELTPLLKDGSVAVRWRAAVAIMRIDPARRSEVRPVLFAALRDKGTSTSLTPGYVIQVVAELDTPATETRPALLAYVNAQPAEQLSALAAALTSAYAGEPAADALWQELWQQSPALPLRREAAAALSRRRQLATGVVPFLIDQVKSLPAGQRERFVVALAQYGEEARAALPVLVDVWRSDAALDARMRTAAAILQIEPRDALVGAWVKEQFRTSANAVQRQQAARVLCKADPTYELLRPALERWTKEVIVVNAAAGLEMLGLLGEHGKAALPLLREVLKSSNPALRARAALSLWQIAKEVDTVVPVLCAVLAEADLVPTANIGLSYVPIPTYSAANFSAQALGEIGGPAQAAVPALRQARSAVDEPLRQAAGVALRKIEGAK